VRAQRPASGEYCLIRGRRGCFFKDSLRRLTISRLGCGNSITSSRSWIQLLFITLFKKLFLFSLYIGCLWSNGDFVGGPSKVFSELNKMEFQRCRNAINSPCRSAVFRCRFWLGKGIRISIPQLWICWVGGQFDFLDVQGGLESSSRFFQQSRKKRQAFSLCFAK